MKKEICGIHHTGSGTGIISAPFTSASQEDGAPLLKVFYRYQLE
jgi:hypothetical protein